MELKLRNRFCEHTKNGSPSSSLHWPTNQSYCPPMCAYIYERQLCRYCFLFLQLLLVAVPSERINLEKLKFFDNSTFAWECSDISTKFSSITSSDFCLLCSTIFFYFCLFVFFSIFSQLFCNNGENDKTWYINKISIMKMSNKTQEKQAFVRVFLFVFIFQSFYC